MKYWEIRLPYNDCDNVTFELNLGIVESVQQARQIARLYMEVANTSLLLTPEELKIEATTNQMPEWSRLYIIKIDDNGKPINQSRELIGYV